MLKCQLLDIIQHHKGKYSYAIGELTKSSKKTVLRLPPYQWEQNSIELIWAQIKNHAAFNITFKFSDVKLLYSQAMGRIQGGGGTVDRVCQACNGCNRIQSFKVTQYKWKSLDTIELIIIHV